MIVMIVRFETTLSEEELLAVARERLPAFRALPGLIQKYYVRCGPGRYGGVYLWESREALEAYRRSDLAAGVGAAYRVRGTPEVEVLETLFPLREQPPSESRESGAG